MSELSSPRPTMRALAVAGAGLVAATTVFVAGPDAGASTRRHEAGGQPVVTTEKSKYGSVLATKHRRTLYLLTADSRDHSTCAGACAGVWPPLLVKSKHLSSHGVESRLLGTIRHGKEWQVTYAGHPLYTYSGDSGGGQVYGEGIVSYGGTWYVVDAKGKAVKTASASSNHKSTSGGSGGYGGYGGSGGSGGYGGY